MELSNTNKIAVRRYQLAQAQEMIRCYSLSMPWPLDAQGKVVVSRESLDFVDTHYSDAKILEMLVQDQNDEH